MVFYFIFFIPNLSIYSIQPWTEIYNQWGKRDRKYCCQAKSGAYWKLLTLFGGGFHPISVNTLLINISQTHLESFPWTTHKLKSLRGHLRQNTLDWSVRGCTRNPISMNARFGVCLSCWDLLSAGALGGTELHVTSASLSCTEEVEGAA